MTLDGLSNVSKPPGKIQMAFARERKSILRMWQIAEFNVESGRSVDMN